MLSYITEIHEKSNFTVYITFIYLRVKNTKDTYMGFLTSTFMKSFSLRMKLQAQRRLMSINLEVGRVQRQMRNQQRQLKYQQKYDNMMMQADLSTRLYGSAGNVGLYDQLKAAQTAGDTSQANSIFGQIQQAQNNYAMQREYNSSYWDDWMEQQLEPLKDEEERLQLEKQQAENELALWTESEKAYAQSAKDDIKSVVPDVG